MSIFTQISKYFYSICDIVRLKQAKLPMDSQELVY